MIKNKYLRKTTRDEVTNCYDSQNYVHVYKCPTCDCSVIRSLLNVHKGTEYHKIAAKLRRESPFNIDNIRTAIIEYKIKQKQQIKNNTLKKDDDTVSISSEEDEKKLKYKTFIYENELERRAQKYERLKAIPRLVNTIQNATKRLTTQQKNKYKTLLDKYPDNKLLLSIKDLVVLPEEKVKLIACDE